MEEFVNKKVILLSGLLLPVFVAAAPFCAVNGGGTTCAYYDVQTCRAAAGIGGACVVNSNEARPDGGSSQRPPIKFIDRNPVTDAMERNTQNPRENATRKLEVEQRHGDIDRQNIEAPVPSPAATQSPTVAHNASLVLVCNLRVGDNKNIQEVTFTINLVDQTVNIDQKGDSHRARISDNYIEWEHCCNNRGKKVNTAINRLTGSLSGHVGTDDVQGKCAAFSQANRKF